MTKIFNELQSFVSTEILITKLFITTFNNEHIWLLLDNGYFYNRYF